MLIEEWVLRSVIGDAHVMAGQLGHLLVVAALPSVSLGVIPMGSARGVAWPTESFSMYDDIQVSVELVSANLTVTQPREITEYERAFVELSKLAVHGMRPASWSLPRSTPSGEGVQVRRSSLRASVRWAEALRDGANGPARTPPGTAPELSRKETP